MSIGHHFQPNNYMFESDFRILYLTFATFDHISSLKHISAVTFSCDIKRN